MQVAFTRDGENINPVLKTCSDLCYGKTPCVRVCSKCPSHHLNYKDENGTCVKPTNNVRRTLFKTKQGKYFACLLSSGLQYDGKILLYIPSYKFFSFMI